MFWLSLAAFASDSGIQRVYDRQIVCGHGVDPPADPATCQLVVRRSLPHDDRPTWALGIAPPGRLFVSYHMPDIDWGHVYRVDVKRAFDPILVSVGLTVDEEICPGEQLQYAHVMSERGPVTHQKCAQIEGDWESEVLLEGHRKLPLDKWVPLWVHRKPGDTDVNAWFVVQVFIATKGQIPERPPQHPYVSAELLRASVPTGLPPRKLVVLEVPEPEGEEAPTDGG